jgi:hypothetical protein
VRLDGKVLTERLRDCCDGRGEPKRGIPLGNGNGAREASEEEEEEEEVEGWA